MSPDPSMYAYPRVASRHRNIYRIPVPQQGGPCNNPTDADLHLLIACRSRRRYLHFHPVQSGIPRADAHWTIFK
jgi:hypothetical protein